MKAKDTTTKSALHDATPTWNGFNYQGKIGLYVCLCIIKQTYTSGSASKNLDHQYFDQFSIEYEWIEDFSILKNDEYLSIHQVKHYNASAFSHYLDAIDTIVCRRIGVISIDDLIPHVLVQTNETKESAAESLLEALEAGGIVDANCRINSDWSVKIPLLKPSHQLPAERALATAWELYTKAYGKNVPVYLHTSSKISPPTKVLQEYSWKHASTGNTFKSSSPKSLNLHYEEDLAFPFILALDDAALDVELQTLISELREIIKPGAIPIKGTSSASCHLAALLLEVDRHIANRHKRIKEKTILSATPLSTECAIRFSTLIRLLEKDFYIQDEEHFGLCAKLIFEYSIESRIDALRDAIQDSIDEGIDPIGVISEKRRLEQYRHDVLNDMPNAKLLTYLEQCSPHHKKTEPHEVYFAKIAQPDAISNTLLRFISLIKQDLFNFFATCAQNERYLPSCIDASDSPSPAAQAHRRIAKYITDAANASAFVNALLYDYHYIAIKAKDSMDTPCHIEPPSFSTVTSSDDTRPVFHEKRRTQLIHYPIAAKRLNGEIC
jgi:hypothetical protein